MSITNMQVDSVHGDPGGQCIVYYRGQDGNGDWHTYGPICTADPDFNPADHLATMQAKLEETLAAREFEREVFA